MKVRLQTILLPTEDICNTPEVYYHSTADGSVTDYDGYFNLFHISKRKKYTDISGVQLVVDLMGYSSISLMHNRDTLSTHVLEASDSPIRYEFIFPYDEYDDGVFWFQLTKDNVNASEYISGAYCALTDSIRPVNLFIDICTYKREKSVLRNLRRMVSFMDSPQNNDISDHMYVGLIDNGKTLNSVKDITDIINSHPNICIIENKNTGGAGGFTRGMKEAIARKDTDRMTHVLLMDDDASFDPDLFVRLFGILGTLRDDYRDLTIGGAMWYEDHPFIQLASGEWFRKMRVVKPTRLLDLRSYDASIHTEMCTTDNELTRYSGWWCCCYSLNIVREDNLPLQIFIHRDDIEYEIRNRLSGNPIVFINGIGVWHKSFDSEYVGIKAYYNVRNTLLMTAIHENNMSLNEVRTKVAKTIITSYLGRMYGEMRFAYLGAMDFLKGDAWFRSLDPEEHHKKLCESWSRLCSFVPLEQIEVSNKNEILRLAKEADNMISDEMILNENSRSDISTAGLLKNLLTVCRLPHTSDAEFIIPYYKWHNIDRHYRNTLFFRPDTGKAMLVKADLKQFFVALRMCISFSVNLKRSLWDSYKKD